MTRSNLPNKGSGLAVTMMTLTVMTFICATSLYIVSQPSSGGMQTAGWQQALTGAESGVDAAIRALNAYQSASTKATAWNGGWVSGPASLPNSLTEATIAAISRTPPAASAPLSDSSHY